jgi:hypothetical protein
MTPGYETNEMSLFETVEVGVSIKNSLYILASLYLSFSKGKNII